MMGEAGEAKRRDRRESDLPKLREGRHKVLRAIAINEFTPVIFNTALQPSGDICILLEKGT